jgi:glycosyltransferase involved in cell wall biosynthesis
MKIAYIGQKGIPAGQGGVERYVEEVAKRMAERGHEVFVYARNNYTDKKLKKYDGINIINLPSISSKNLDAISHTLLATIHALFQDYDVIHFNSIGPTSLSFLVKIFKRKTALVSTFQCQDYFHQKWALPAKLYLHFSEFLTCKIPDITIVVSRILKNYVFVKYGCVAARVPNGAKAQITEKDDALKNWNLEKNKYILYVGRFVRHKGIHYLIQAFKNLENKKLAKGLKLAIVGDGFYTDDYTKEIKDLSSGQKNIIFTGPQSGENLKQLFSHALVFVQPSESEGLSLALLEAMGYGKAIVASDIAENSEAVEGNTALSFKSGDAKDLEDKIAYLLNNPSLALEMGKRALERAKTEFNWDKIVIDIEKLYQEVLLKKRADITFRNRYERNI